MAGLFDTTEINGMELKNRIVRSATWEGMCDDVGRPTQKLIDYYCTLAEGGVGLIITGYTFVRTEGKQMPGKMGIHTDDLEKDHQTLTDTVHKVGGKIVVQLVHAGGQTDSQTAGRQPLAPSSIKVDQFPEQPEELSQGEIRGIILAFGAGAARAKQWGYDGVQLHGAHGYLINQFLSPLTNKRNDEYGGNFANRSRFLLEVYEEIRGKVGKDYPVMIKLNASDNVAGGLELSEGVRAAELLAKEGIDGIEVSAGTSASGEKVPAREKINKQEKEAYNLSEARAIKEVTNCPVMLVGGIRSLDIATRVIEQHQIEYISLSRPLIREPNLPKRWMNRDHAKAECVSCNKCFLPGLKEGGIYCVVEKKLREKKKGQS